MRETQELLSAAKSAPAAEQTADYTDVKVRGVRRLIAKNMSASLAGSAQLTHMISFDATQLTAARAAFKNGGLPEININHIVMYAVSRTLKKHPYLNAHWQEESIRLFEDVNLGMAVATPRGLVVPTIFRADKLSLLELAREAKELAKKTLEGKVSMEALSGGTFTVSNLGTYGITAFTPIINPPQTGILGVCAAQDSIKLVDGRIVPYRSMGLSLTYDHRALDGAPASQFLRDLCDMLEGIFDNI